MADDRELILARRRRLIALALAGGAAATTACSQACLRIAPDTGPVDAGTDAPERPDDADGERDDG